MTAFLDAALALHQFKVDPDWRDGIRAHFGAIEAASRTVFAVPLDDETEAAPVFTP